MSPVKKPVRPEGGQNRSPLEDRRVRLALAALLGMNVLCGALAPAAPQKAAAPVRRPAAPVRVPLQVVRGGRAA